MLTLRVLLAPGGHTGTVKDERKWALSYLFIRAAFLLVFRASRRLDVEGSHVFLPLVPLGDPGLVTTTPGPTPGQPSGL